MYPFYSDKTKYNNLRNQELDQEGDEVECTIKIYLADQEMTAYDKFQVVLFRR